MSPPEIKNAYSDQLKQLIYSCLSENPWERPTARDLRTAAQVKSYSINRIEPSRNVITKIYKICLLLLVVVVSVFTWIKVNDTIERKEYEQMVAESNTTALTTMRNADSIVEQQKSKLLSPKYIDIISDDTLGLVIQIYDDALMTQNCSDSVYNVIKAHREVAVNDLLLPTYEHLKYKEQEYNSIGAYSASQLFRVRRVRIEELLKKIN